MIPSPSRKANTIGYRPPFPAADLVEQPGEPLDDAMLLIVQVARFGGIVTPMVADNSPP